MSDDSSQGHGDDQKSQGDKDGDKKTDDNQITLTKEKLSDKIVNGRNEGIEKGVNDTLSVINETLDTDFSDLDTMKESLSEAHIGDIEESEVVQQLQNKLSEKDSKIENLSKKIQDNRISDSVESQLNDALGDKDLLVDFEDLKALHNRNTDIGYVEKDGEVYATKDGNRFLNDEGDYTKYSESVYNYAKSKNLIQGNAKGGSGGGTVENPGSSGNPFETGNVTEQAKLFKSNPEKAKRLKKAAGK